MDRRAIVLQVLITALIAFVFAALPQQYDSWTLARAISQYHRNPTPENQRKLDEEAARVGHEIWVGREHEFVVIFLLANTCYSIRKPRVASSFFLATCSAVVAFTGVPWLSASNGFVVFGSTQLSLLQFQVLMVCIWFAALLLVGTAFAWPTRKARKSADAVP